VNIDLRPFLVLWIVLAAAVISLIVYRKTVASKEDDSLHVSDGVNVSQQQVSVAQKLEVIDKWGKILTAVAVVFGVVLGAAYMYQTWVTMSRSGL
jgi:hypothetical protein